MISLTRPEIEALIDWPRAARMMEEAYCAASLGHVNLPPVGHITFPEQDGDCHIKYGHLRGAQTFVIKIATGFANNPVAGLPSGNGLVLVMSARTGEVEAILHDEMALTDIRTGLGGAIATRLLARSDSRRVLVVGTGQQARRQIEAHAALLSDGVCFELWGRKPERAEELLGTLSAAYDVSLVHDLEAAVGRADIIVTATGARAPLIQSDWVTDGTHITAVGADAPGKQELDAALVGRADVVAVDLVTQCLDHGEVSHAAKEGLIAERDLHELGTLLSAARPARVDDAQITIADLTGIAAQDIAMAQAVLSAWAGAGDQHVWEASAPMA